MVLNKQIQNQFISPPHDVRLWIRLEGGSEEERRRIMESVCFDLPPEKYSFQGFPVDETFQQTSRLVFVSLSSSSSWEEEEK